MSPFPFFAPWFWLISLFGTLGEWAMGRTFLLPCKDFLASAGIQKAIGVLCEKKRIQENTLFAGKGGSLHTSLMVEACILEAQKDVKCKKYFKQDLDLLRLYKMQTNYKLMESYVKTNKIFD